MDRDTTSMIEAKAKERAAWEAWKAADTVDAAIEAWTAWILADNAAKAAEKGDKKNGHKSRR